jgi:hypothetical protein
MINTKKHKGGDGKSGDGKSGDGKSGDGKSGKGDAAGKDGAVDAGRMCIISLPTFNIITLNNLDSLITIDFGQSINYKNNKSTNKCLILSLAYAANISPCELLSEITRTITDLTLEYDDYRIIALDNVKKSLQNNDFIDFIALVQLIDFTGLFPDGLICLNLKPTTAQTEIYFGNINLKTPTIINVGSYHFFCAHSGNYDTSAKMVLANKERFNDYTDTINNAPIKTVKGKMSGGTVAAGVAATAAAAAGAAGAAGAAAGAAGGSGNDDRTINIKSTSFEDSITNKEDVKLIKDKISKNIKVNKDKIYNYNMVESDINDTASITVKFTPSRNYPHFANIGVNINKQLASSQEQTTNYLDQLFELSKNQALPDREKKPNKSFFPYYKKQFSFKRARTEKDKKDKLKKQQNETRKILAREGVLSSAANIREQYIKTNDALKNLFNPPKVVNNDGKNNDGKNNDGKNNDGKNNDGKNNDDNDSLSVAIAIAIQAAMAAGI